MVAYAAGEGEGRLTAGRCEYHVKGCKVSIFTVDYLAIWRGCTHTHISTPKILCGKKFNP